MPFANRLRYITRLREQLGNGGLVFQAACLAIHRRTLQTMPMRNPSGQRGGPRWRTAWLRVAGGKLQAAARKLVEIGRRRADRDATAIAAEIAPADVVHHENKKVGLFAAARPMFGELLEGGIDLLGVHEGGLKVLRLANGARCDRVEVGHDLPFRLWSPGVRRAVGVSGRAGGAGEAASPATRCEIIAPAAAGVQPPGKAQTTGAGRRRGPRGRSALNQGITPLVRVDSGDERRRNRIRRPLEG
jgi:hypothetical protein